MPPAFLIDTANKRLARQDRARKVAPALRQDVDETYLQFCKSMEAALMPLPNRMLEANETWDTKIPISIRAGTPLELADLDVHCVFEGTRTRNDRSEGVITLNGVVKGRGLLKNNVGGKVTGKIAFDLTGGFIAEAQMRILSSYDLQDIDITTSLDVHLDHTPGNPHNIAAPTDFVATPSSNPAPSSRAKPSSRSPVNSPPRTPSIPIRCSSRKTPA